MSEDLGVHQEARQRSLPGLRVKRKHFRSAKIVGEGQLGVAGGGPAGWFY